MALADQERLQEANWPTEISNVESKKAIAKQLAANLEDGQVIGVGSGTTSYLTLLELKETATANGMSFSVVGTSIEIERISMALGLSVQKLGQQEIAWSFDGADEVDPNNRLIKGRGGAMFREKLVMATSSRRYIVADESKKVAMLGEKFAAPVEVVPDSIDLVRAQLEAMGATNAPLRPAGGKDGPVVTEHGGVILDVNFANGVPAEAELEAIPGVLCTGVFDRWPFELLMV